MTDEEYEEMLKRGYMTDEDWGEISRGAEKEWDELEASRAENDVDDCMLTGGIGSMSKWADNWRATH